MEHLIERFGEPGERSDELPYERKQILSFVDECQAMVDSWEDWEAFQAIDLATACQKLETIEALASWCHQIDRMRFPPYHHDDVVQLVEIMTTRMRQCVFDLSGLPELAFQGICKHCSRVFRQALDRKMDIEGRSELKTAPGSTYSECGLTQYLGRFHDNKLLLAVDTWPNFPTLKTRFNSSGCQVCGLLRDSLQLPAVPKTHPFTHGPYEPRVTLWFQRVTPHQVVDELNDPSSSDDGNDEWVDVEEEETDHNGWRKKARLLHMIVKGHDGISSSHPICTFSLNATSGQYPQSVCHTMRALNVF